MNLKIAALVSVAILVCAGGAVYLLYSNPQFGWEFEDCYLDVSDAETVYLGDTVDPTVLGTNYENTYGGPTLYKFTSIGEKKKVQMYKFSETGERLSVEINRGVKSIEEAGDMMLIVFYGLPSKTDSHQCYTHGYRYDPNSQLTYLVNMETGRMYNLTYLTREIIPLGGNQVFDAQYALIFLKQEGAVYKFAIERPSEDNIRDNNLWNAEISFDESAQMKVNFLSILRSGRMNPDSMFEYDKKIQTEGLLLSGYYYDISKDQFYREGLDGQLNPVSITREVMEVSSSNGVTYLRVGGIPLPSQVPSEIIFTKYGCHPSDTLIFIVDDESGKLLNITPLQQGYVYVNENNYQNIALNPHFESKVGEVFKFTIDRLIDENTKERWNIDVTFETNGNPHIEYVSKV